MRVSDQSARLRYSAQLRKWTLALALCMWALAIVFSVPTLAGRQLEPADINPTLSIASDTPVNPQAIISKYCITCHNQKLRTGGLVLDPVDATNPAAQSEIWEKVVAKLQQGSMPPPGRPRPDQASYKALTLTLEDALDRAWLANPNPGRIAAVHRLNRAEYNNAIRDLLALDVDLKTQLPGDETADGSFDNLASSLSISTAHLERYASIARQVTRTATGLPPTRPGFAVFEIPLHIIQDDQQSEELPFGSRGGIAVHYQFPVDGEYAIRVRLQRQYQDYLKGMGWPQQLEIRLDGKLLKRFTVGGAAQGRPAAASYAGDGEPGYAGDDSWEKYMLVTGDEGLEVRVPVQAGPRVVGVSFVREMWEPAGLPQPLQRARVIANDQVYMGYANVHSVEIGGPYQAVGPAKDTPSRRAIFVCQPQVIVEELSCANKILSRLARLAYRRPVTKEDVQTLLDFFNKGRQEGKSFDAGIQLALERMLIDPDFLLRIYLDKSVPRQATSVYRLSDLDVASRLSFFLWSSIPDDPLLSLAERGQLTRPATLEREVRRMLADPRAVNALVNNFAAQWLNLRRVEEVVVDPLLYPNYDLSLMQSLRRETELFVGSTIREDRSVVELLDADYTFVDERLARHYEISGIYGSRFRRVAFPNHDQRGGLLTHGALLATASYPDRTSPVLRGKWLVDNILGLPIPPPPPGVNTSIDNKPGEATNSIRERLAQHRQNPSCSSCHSVIDPLGFALENFDVIGAWRTKDERGNPVDTSGTTVSGQRIDGLPGLRAFLLSPPGQFPRTVTEKLMTYALGRMLEHYDRPAVRKIVRDAAAEEYRWSSLIIGIVKSPAFLMRTSQTSN
jgi:mono/diheme cytochrome c family protein